jgi:dTDP-4-amino-4,6-dideoxygalactose transaminase
MNVPMLDLKEQFAAIRDEVLEAIIPILDAQQCVNGPAVVELESAVAEFCGASAAVGLSSGTDALIVSLMGLDIGAGDEVITTPFTFFGTAGSIWRTGAKPVFVDIDPVTFNIDPAKIAAAITPKTKAIMPVHLYGQMADMDAIMSIAAEHGLSVIEDAAQSIGAASDGRKACSMGTVGCLSFYPTKNLGGIGDGGMVVTNDVDLAEKIRKLRQHGETTRYHHKYVGGNFRLDTLQAATLLIKLKYLDSWAAGRDANAAIYNDKLAGLGAVVTPAISAGNESVYNQYVIRAERRDELQKHLADNTVGCGVYYPLGLHEQECFASLGYVHGDFPETERAAEQVLALPIYPELKPEQVAFAAETIRAFYA